jgi:hypothetical protein
MFLTIQANQIFDLRMAQAPETHPSYWLAQLRKTDWLHLLNFVDVKMSAKTRKQAIAEVALAHFEFTYCEGRGEIWQMWNELRRDHRILVIQFRHSEADWTRGVPEFVDFEKNDPLGFVNIAGRLFCKVK